MKLSLKVRLMISYGLLALFLIISLLLISNYTLEHHFQSYVKQKQERENKNLVVKILDEYVKVGTPNLQFFDKLGYEALNEGILLMVYDAEGKELYCAECSNREDCDNMREQMQKVMQQRYPGWKGEYMEKVYPLENNGKNYGNVTLGYYGPFFFNKEDLEFIRIVNIIYFIVAITLLIISFIVSAILASRIARPIKHVIDKTKAIEQSHYSERIQFTSNTTEIDQLIATVNTLANTLEIQQQIKKRMANDYGHEFRTPLAVIQSSLEGMIDGILEVTPQRLENCRAEILRLSRMTSQINKLVEIDNNNLLLNKERFNFGDLLNQNVSAFECELYEKGLTMELNAPSCELNADRDKISQVIVNLLSNAIKYTNTGGRIHVSIVNYTDRIVFTVADTGEGIDEQDIPYIFEYLYRTDRSRARGTGGSGIGLSVVKAIVTAHEGQIEVKSKLGLGSEFIVTFPKK